MSILITGGTGFGFEPIYTMEKGMKDYAERLSGRPA
jgi:inosine/xanthosine triphosphate pyrophosphatase family protein